MFPTTALSPVPLSPVPLSAVPLSGADLALIATYAALLWVPGLAVGALLGLGGRRMGGWTLLALAPLLTYGLAAICGPGLAWLGIPWTPVSVGTMLLVVLAVVGLLGWWGPRRRPDPLPAWTAGGQLVVAVAVAVAGLLGASVILRATGGLAAIPQDWDALLHANGIRYLADTGDSSVYGMYTVNTFASGAQAYYPHAYHLLGALVFDLTGVSIPEGLNAQSTLLPLMLALCLVALVRAYHGRVSLAAFAALVSPAATAMPYDLLWRGPLFPFATGLALVLGIVVVLRDYLDRPSVASALPVVLGGAGLLGLHSSMVFTAALFALPALVARWWSAAPAVRRRPVRELGLLVAPAVVGGVLVAPHLTGALSTAGGVLSFSWPQTSTPAHALGEVIGFSTAHPHPQLWLLAFLALGLLGYRALGQLRWIGVSAVVSAGLFVLSAAYPQPWAQTLTSLWWNDRWRLAAVVTLALLPLVAHGLVRGYDGVLTGLLLPIWRRVGGLRRTGAAGGGRGHPAWAAPLALGAVAVAFLVLTDHGYAERNIARTSASYGYGSTVTAAERAAIDALAELVGPGERVMNDRFDGTGWMYALTGVRPVAAHFGRGEVGAGVELLGRAFDRYDLNPEVQAEVARLNIRWVIVGEAFIRPGMQRQPGLDHLDQVDALDLVYEVEGVRIYQLARPIVPVAAESVSMQTEGG